MFVNLTIHYTIHDMEKSKIDSRYDSHFDNHAPNFCARVLTCKPEPKVILIVICITSFKKKLIGNKLNSIQICDTDSIISVQYRQMLNLCNLIAESLRLCNDEGTIYLPDMNNLLAMPYLSMYMVLIEYSFICFIFCINF